MVELSLKEKKKIQGQGGKASDQHFFFYTKCYLTLFQTAKPLTSPN